jgi:hypothetical protein
MLTECKNQRITKQTATSAVEGKRKRGKYVKDGETRLKKVQI